MHTSVGERNQFGESLLEQLREATVKTPVRNQERFQGLSRHLFEGNDVLCLSKV